MKFEKNGKFYSIIRTDDMTSDGAAIFKYVAFDARGQMVDADEIAATNMREAKNIICERT